MRRFRTTKVFVCESCGKSPGFLWILGFSLKTNLFRSIAAGIPIIRRCFWNPQQRVFTRFLPQWQIVGFLSLSLCVCIWYKFQLVSTQHLSEMVPYGTPKSNFHGCTTSIHIRERRRVSRMLRRRRARDFGQVPASKSLIWCTYSSSQNLAKIYKLTWSTNRLYHHYNHYHNY